MSARIHLVFDPDDSVESRDFLQGLHRLEHGRIVTELRPDTRNLDWLAGDLLRALGKRSTVTKHSRNSRKLWNAATAWLEGEQITDLFVSRAYLAAPAQWRHLIELPETCGCDVWLIIQRNELSKYRSAAVDGLDLEELSAAAFTRRWRTKPKPTKRTTSAASPPEREQLPLGLTSTRVPLVEFPTFRDACKEQLSPLKFHQIDTAYQAAGADVMVWLRKNTPTEKSVARFLRDMIVEATTLDAALVRLRAAQVVFHLHWWNVKVDPEMLAAARDADHISPLTTESAELVRQYANTHYAALRPS